MLTWSTALGATFSAYLPLLSVMVPLVVPFSVTEAPLRGSLPFPVITPVTLIFWALTDWKAARPVSRRMKHPTLIGIFISEVKIVLLKSRFFLIHGFL